MGRAPCCDKANVKKGPWSPEEDAKLKSYIEAKGTGGNWIALPQKIGLKRCGKSCRLRWLNYLRPNIKHGGFTEEEENIICDLYISIGSRWSIIAANLPGRTDNDIKNYWNTRLKKKLMAKQRKEQQAAASHLLEQDIIKRESETFLVNQTLNQAPYWLNQQTSIPIIVSQHQPYLGNQDQYTKLYDENQFNYTNNNNSYQHSTTNDQFYVGPNDNQGVSNINFTQWLNDEYDNVNGNNVIINNMHQGHDIIFPSELEAYLNNQLIFDRENQSYSGVDVGSSVTTSNSAASSSYGDINSMVNTPVSSFDAYQSGVVMQGL